MPPKPAYISSDGSVAAGGGVFRGGLVAFLARVYHFILGFFMTLFAPFFPSERDRVRSDISKPINDKKKPGNGGFWPGGSGGGGGAGGPGGAGGSGGSSGFKPRIVTFDKKNTTTFSGCAGGSCG